MSYTLIFLSYVFDYTLDILTENVSRSRIYLMDVVLASLCRRKGLEEVKFCMRTVRTFLKTSFHTAEASLPRASVRACACVHGMAIQGSVHARMH